MDTVPASWLRRLALIYSKKETSDPRLHAYDAEMGWRNHLLKLGIPVIFDWDNEDDIADPIPDGVLSQLIGQRFGSGMQFFYQREACYVVEINFDDDLIALGKTITGIDTQKITRLAGVETKYINLET